MSKTLIAVISTCLLAVGVSATFMFPVIKNINNLFSKEEEVHAEDTTQTNDVASVETTYTDGAQNQTSNPENPNVNINTTTKDHNSFLNEDTIKSDYLIDDAATVRGR